MHLLTNVTFSRSRKNLLLHRFGVFDFLGFVKAPNGDVDRYKREVDRGLYPPEIDDTQEGSDDGSSGQPVLPWTFCPSADASTCLQLVEELLHLIIILITVRTAHPACMSSYFDLLFPYCSLPDLLVLVAGNAVTESCRQKGSCK